MNKRYRFDRIFLTKKINIQRRYLLCIQLYKRFIKNNKILKEGLKKVLNGGDIYQKIIDISTEEKEEKKIQELEKRIRKKANKKIFETIGVKISISKARGELYYALKELWYGNVI